MLRVYVLPVLVAAFAATASAQTIEIRTNRPSMEMTGVRQVRISLGVNMFVPAPIDNSEESLKAQEGARRMIYDLAAHECGILREALASECRLESVNVNAQRLPGNRFGGQQKVDGYNINGNVSFRVVPK